MASGGGMDIVLAIGGLFAADVALAWLGEWLRAGWREMRADAEGPPGRSPDWVSGPDGTGRAEMCTCDICSGRAACEADHGR